MGTESNALDFVIGLSTKGLDAATSLATRAFSLLAGAAEFAHKALTGSPSNAPPGTPSGLVRKFRTGALAIEGEAGRIGVAMHRMGTAALVGGWGLLVAGGYEATQMYIEHTKEMIKFRRAVGMTSEDMNSFSSQLIGAASQYGTALGTANAVAFALSRGLGRTTEDAAKLGGQLGQLEYNAGIAGDASVDLMRSLSDYGKIMTADEVVHFEHVLTNLTSDIRGNASALVGLIGGNKDLIATWDAVPGRANKMVDFIAVMGAAYQEVKGDVRELKPLLDGLANSTSDTAQIFRANATDVRTMMTFLTNEAKKMRADTGLKQDFMSKFGITEVNVVNKLIESTAKWESTQKRFDAYRMESTEQLTERERKRMSNFEKIGENLRKASSAAAGLWGNIDSTLGVTTALARKTEELNALLVAASGGTATVKPQAGMADTRAQAATSTATGMAFLNGISFGLVGMMAKADTGAPTVASAMADMATRKDAADYKRQLAALKAKNAHLDRMASGVSDPTSHSMYSPPEQILPRLTGSTPEQQKAAEDTADNTSRMVELLEILASKAASAPFMMGGKKSGFQEASTALNGN